MKKLIILAALAATLTGCAQPQLPKNVVRAADEGMANFECSKVPDQVERYTLRHLREDLWQCVPVPAYQLKDGIGAYDIDSMIAKEEGKTLDQYRADRKTAELQREESLRQAIKDHDAAIRQIKRSGGTYSETIYNPSTGTMDTHSYSGGHECHSYADQNGGQMYCD